MCPRGIPTSLLLLWVSCWFPFARERWSRKESQPLPAEAQGCVQANIGPDSVVLSLGDKTPAEKETYSLFSFNAGGSNWDLPLTVI